MTNNYVKQDLNLVTKKDLGNEWLGVVINYIYHAGNKYEDIFAHAKVLNRNDDPEDFYYEVMIPSLDFFYCYIDRQKIIKFL